MSDSCATVYPILMVHGMGFRDGKFGYWGRIPEVLRKNGARVFHGGQDGNASIEYNAGILAGAVDRILRETGAEKVNVIAHSKGGLETRYLISTMGCGDRIASLTTISTPHRGSKALSKIMKLPKPLRFLIYLGAKITDFLHLLSGDKKPDTWTCIRQLTREYMAEFAEKNPADNRVLYRSCAFVMKNALSDGIFIFPYLAVKALSAQSDGFLTPEEVQYGEFLGTFTGTGRRGISHCDEVDFRRRRLSSKKPQDEHHISDITELYIRLVRELKERGL